LQAGGDVRRLAQCQVLLARLASHLTHHDHTGVDTQTHGQLHTAIRLQARIELLQGLDDPEPRPHRPLRIVFMGQGVAKVGQQAIAEVLSNIALMAGYDFGTGPLIGAPPRAGPPGRAGPTSAWSPPDHKITR